ncbi:ArnT family glycosyltransferase [Polluticoccus soli]|uniref:ArnT family glycosyltransferase n=1 Tax=Polluticoccus soli TaxID=3034150 RepID=UPI0023E264CF|nr:glycosyltransferase family 39 protein [Flavipsychrobacter sp. JY13-12]
MRHNTTIWVGIFLYIVYHFLSLSYSPLPWFDEVSFASMTQSYLVDGTFMETVRRYSVPHPRPEYGPIYFVLQSYIIKLFGLSLYVFRMNSLLFGFLNVFLVYKICQKFELGKSAAVMTIILLLLNPALNQVCPPAEWICSPFSFFCHR